jgi:hypothetical protein
VESSTPESSVCLRVNLLDGLAALNVGHADMILSVEEAGAEQAGSRMSGLLSTR